MRVPSAAAGRRVQSIRTRSLSTPRRGHAPNVGINRPGSEPIHCGGNHQHVALHGLTPGQRDLAQVRQALGRFVKNSEKAGDVIDGFRAFIKKVPSGKDSFEINEAILEVIALTRNEVVKNDLSMETQLAEHSPLIEGDRVQLQQSDP
jgi:hypothetical protein